MKKPLYYILSISIFTASIISCEKVFFVEEPADDPEAIFEYFWKSYNENYAVFDERGIDWNEMYNVYRPFVTENTTEDELYSVITNMLAPLDDGHVQLIAENRTVFYSNIYYNYRIDDSLFNLEILKTNYLDAGFVSKEEYIYGTINGDITYIYFPFIADNMEILNEVLDLNSSSKGLIVDLRHNSGGDFTWALSALHRLTDQKRLVFTSRTKNGPGMQDYTQWYDWYLEPGGKYYNKPIVLLTDRYTISAGERTTMMFMQLPNVTIIGDTTNAAHSTLVTAQLANGWFYSLSTQDVKLPDGISYEGVGLAPDIYIKNDLVELQNGIDRVLEEAISKF